MYDLACSQNILSLLPTFLSRLRGAAAQHYATTLHGLPLLLSWVKFHAIPSDILQGKSSSSRSVNLPFTSILFQV